MKMTQGASLRAREESADAGRAEAGELLLEAGAGGREERHLRLARGGAREQGLARARGAGQEYAARRAPAEAAELFGVAQKLDGLGQLGAGLVHARHVLEGDVLRAGGVLGVLIAVAHVRVDAPADEAEREQRDDRQRVGEEGRQHAGLERPVLDLHVVAREGRGHLLLRLRVGQHRLRERAVGRGDRHQFSLNLDGGGAARLGKLAQLRVVDVVDDGLLPEREELEDDGREHQQKRERAEGDRQTGFLCAGDQA